MSPQYRWFTGSVTREVPFLLLSLRSTHSFPACTNIFPLNQIQSNAHTLTHQPIYTHLLPLPSTGGLFQLMSQPVGVADTAPPSVELNSPIGALRPSRRCPILPWSGEPIDPRASSMSARISGVTRARLAGTALGCRTNVMTRFSLPLGPRWAGRAGLRCLSHVTRTGADMLVRTRRVVTTMSLVAVISVRDGIALSAPRTSLSLPRAL